MKYLVLILVIALVLWLVRAGRRRDKVPPPRAPDRPRHEDMVVCAQCGVHLPRSESFPGRGGVFCSEIHRAEHERLNAPP